MIDLSMTMSQDPPPYDLNAFKSARRDNKLATGWREAKAPDGRLYYISRPMKRTTWEKPGNGHLRYTKSIFYLFICLRKSFRRCGSL